MSDTVYGRLGIFKGLSIAVFTDLHLNTKLAPSKFYNIIVTYHAHEGCVEFIA